MYIIPLIVGLLFFAMGVYIVFDYYWFNKSAFKTQGIVISYEQYKSKSRDSSNSTVYRPTFEFTLNGVTYNVESNTGFTSKVIPIGSSTTVLYEKGNEEKARLAKENSYG